MNIEFTTEERPWGYIFTHKNNTETIYLIDDLSFLRQRVKSHGMVDQYKKCSSVEEAIEEFIEIDLSHETIHNVLNKNESFETSKLFDNIDKNGEIINFSEFEAKDE